MNPSNFWFIKLRDYGSRGERKLPLEQWGGYDTDFEENEDVYTYAETKKSGHTNWGVCGYRGDGQVLIIDFDAYKVDDFDPDEAGIPSPRPPIVKSIDEDREVPGFHFYVHLEDEDVDFATAHEHVEVKGNGSGHAVSPWHSDEYQIANDVEIISFFDNEVIENFTYDGKNLVGSSQSYSYSGEVDIDIPDDPPEDMPLCLEKCLERRANVERHTGNPWVIDSMVGRRLVAFGYSKEEALSLLREYEPRDGYDQQESIYQMDQLYRKELYPDSHDSLAEYGIDASECTCQYCGGDQTIVAEDPVHFSEFEIDEKEHLIMQSVARTGKSHTLIEESIKLRDEEKIVYVSGSHSEGEAQVSKFRRHGVRTCHLVGKERARSEYDITFDAPRDPSFVAMDPKEASLRDDVHGYHGLLQGAEAADVVVTVPELLHELDDFDWLIMTEEAAFDRMLSSEIKVMDVERLRAYDRSVKGTLHEYKSTALSVIDYIDELGATQPMHDHIDTAAQVIVDICNIIEDWSPGNWTQVEENWEGFVEDVNDRLDDIAYDTPPDLYKCRTWLMNQFNRATTPILNFMFADGVFTYENGNRKQLFVIGDTDRCFVELPSDLLVWTAGNNIPAMEEFHDIVHSDKPTVKPFYGGFTPVQDSISVVKMTGGRNPNEQSRKVQEIVEEVQLIEQDVGNLLISGHSEQSAQHAKRIRKCVNPGAHDDMDALRDYAENGVTVAAAENMWCVEGIDTPFFEMGALYRGDFATPREDYIAEQTGDDSLSRAERIRAAQNAILRPSNVPGEGTGSTPVIVPEMHVPDEIFEMFEMYGITVVEAEDVTQARKMIIRVLDLDAEIHHEMIVDPDEAPDTPRPFEALFKETAG